MTDLYSLPETANIGGCEYGLNTDFRVILKIMQCLEDGELPELLRWRVALGLFYQSPVPLAHRGAAMTYLADFLSCGNTAEKPGPKLLDWQVDAADIIAGVNAAAGCEIRSLKKVHWWTFLSWFHAMPPGALSTVVGIREKLRKGKPLDPWEKEFYRENRQRIQLRRPHTPEEQAEKDRLNRLLGR